jgi:hypothetical protein
MRAGLVLLIAACGNSPKAGVDAAGGADAPPVDGVSVDASSATGLGMVTGVAATTCPANAPPGATCEQLTVVGCPSIENEAIHATIALVPAQGTRKGTVVHFKGGGGEGFEETGLQQFGAAGLQQVLVSWATDWEQTQSLGIKVAACRPATVLKWIFDDPTLHGGSRQLAFCGQGFSGGSGQLGYALAHYGMGAYLDYVNELSGPPFARIDLGCDFSQPATAQVCGAADTMRLPTTNLNTWENTTTCGSTTPSAAEVAKWNSDSISVGGVYSYPQTDVEFFDCTNNSTAVTAMAQIYEQQITAAAVGYHCYTQADSCTGESLGAGAGAATQALIAGCTPRH